MTLLSFSARRPAPRGKPGWVRHRTRRGARHVDRWLLAVTLVAAMDLASGERQASAAGDAVATPEMMQSARVHLSAGKGAYQRGDYGLARREFEQAYEILPLPDILRNLAETAEKQGKLDDGIGYIEKYLAADPAAADAQDLTKHAEELRARKAQQAAAAKAPPTATAPTGPSRPGLAGPLAVAGTGLAVLLGGVGLGVGALSAQQSFSDMVSGGTAQWPDVQATYDRGTALNIAAITLDVVGGVGLAAGLAWTGYVAYVRRHRRAAPAAGSETTANLAR